MSIGNSAGNATEPWILVQMHMANGRYQQNSHKWQTWQLGFQWYQRGIELVTRMFHSATVSHCDHFSLHQADY